MPRRRDTDMKERNSFRANREIAEQSGHVLVLSERDSIRVIELLEKPFVPNAKMMAAARALPPLR